MSDEPKNCRSAVIPAIRYRDAPTAIDWLCKAFGFEKQAVYANQDGSIAHAQLTFGNGMVMLSSIADTEYSRLTEQPGDIGKTSAQTICLIVNEPDTVFARAKSAGAEIVLAIEDKDYGGRAFTCRDLEGHLWSVGDYNPWETQ